MLQVGDSELDTLRRVVRRGDRVIELSPQEFSLLEYPIRHPHQVISRTQIAQHVWRFDFYPTFRPAKCHIENKMADFYR